MGHFLSGRGVHDNAPVHRACETLQYVAAPGHNRIHIARSVATKQSGRETRLITECVDWCRCFVSSGGVN